MSILDTAKRILIFNRLPNEIFGDKNEKRQFLRLTWEYLLVNNDSKAVKEFNKQNMTERDYERMLFLERIVLNVGLLAFAILTGYGLALGYLIEHFNNETFTNIIDNQVLVYLQLVLFLVPLFAIHTISLTIHAKLVKRRRRFKE